MTAKMWLSRAYWLDKEIEALRAEKEKAYIEATRTVQSTDGERVQSSGGHGDEKMAAYADYAMRLDELIREKVRIKTEILNVINRIPNARHRILLRRRYLLCQKWEDIREALDQTDVRATYYTHGRALASVEKILKKI